MLANCTKIFCSVSAVFFVGSPPWTLFPSCVVVLHGGFCRQCILLVPGGVLDAVLSLFRRCFSVDIGTVGGSFCSDDLDHVPLVFVGFRSTSSCVQPSTTVGGSSTLL